MKSIIFAAVYSIVGANKRNDALTNWYQGIDPKNVVYAVSCGSEEPLTDVAGINYSADKGFRGGVTSSDGYSKKKWTVPNAEVYQSERWSDSDFSYSIPVDTSKDQQYTLILKFSEVYFEEQG